MLGVVAAAVVAVVGFAVARAFAGDGSGTPMPQAGQAAPGFTLPNEENQPVSLDRYRGRWVVLYFYPKDMTPGCTIEARHFQRDREQYEALNAVILGVSLDTVASHKKFCAKDSLHFTLLADPSGQVVREYGSLGSFARWKMAKRNTFLIDPEGRIVKVWAKVNATAHSAEVLAEIRETQAKQV